MRRYVFSLLIAALLALACLGDSGVRIDKKRDAFWQWFHGAEGLDNDYVPPDWTLHSIMRAVGIGGMAMSVALGAGRIVFTGRHAKRQVRSNRRNREPGAFKILGLFYWFCGAANREIIQVAEADLKKDIRDMRKKGRGQTYIRAVVSWKTIGIIMPIVWDSLLRLLGRIVPLGRLIARIKTGL